MDFDSLPRRDLQFFCKRNKIPANMTNIAMADALKALEIVEGIDEFVNQSEATCDQSPTSVAKNLPSAARTAARTTRRKATKDETQSSELVTRSCLVTSKSLAQEMDQENRNANMHQNPSVPQSRRKVAAASVAVKLDVTNIKPEANVSKTPAARSTRRAQAAASSKKEESVQRVYSTRRAVKLLEESMADLSLKTKESLNVPAKKNKDSPAGSESQAKSDENSVKTEEAEVISVRDLNDSLEKEWDGLKNDPDIDILYGDLGDITFSDAKASEEQMNGIDSDKLCGSDGTEEALVSDKKKSQAPSSPLADKKLESEDEWSDTDFEISEMEENSVGCEELPDAESEEAPVSDKKTPASSSSALTGKEETKTPFEAESEISEMEENSVGSEELTDSESEEAPVSDKKTPASSSSTLSEKEETKTPFAESTTTTPAKNKENAAEMVLNNNGEEKTEAEDAKKEEKKKTINEESLKDVSIRQLTKMVKELAIKKASNNTSAE